ncbi:hypothetical protein FQA39_LY07842 [Lamprigera yunnana]|nr:hypothetical protein FQA39_LY07842 [Lamprigera yunnana]
MYYEAVLAFAFLSIVVDSAKLPANFPVCKLIPSELPECFARAVEETLSILTNPVPELGLPSINPIVIERLEFNGGSGNIVLNQKLNDVKIYNMQNTKVTKADINIDRNYFNNALYTHLPEMKFEADYEIDGKMLVVPIRGSGKMKLQISDLTTVLRMNGTHEFRKGVEYLKIFSTACSLEPKLVKIQFDNLFNGDKTLGDNVNKMLNDNWKEVFGEFKSAYEDAIAQYMHSISARVFDRVPLNDLFPQP